MSDRNGNENCLEGYECPKCGNHSRLRIAATSCFTVCDDGTDEYEDVEWEDSSYCGCPECGYEGLLANFRIVDDEYPAEATTAGELGIKHCSGCQKFAHYRPTGEAWTTVFGKAYCPACSSQHALQTK